MLLPYCTVAAIIVICCRWRHTLDIDGRRVGLGRDIDPLDVEEPRRVVTHATVPTIKFWYS